MRALIGIVVGLAVVVGLATVQLRAEGPSTRPASPAASRPAYDNAAFDADLDKYAATPQRSWETATALSYSDTVLPRVIDKLGLDAATEAKARAAYDAWRAKVNPKNELRYKKLTALRNQLAKEGDAARKAAIQTQIDSLHWPTQGEQLVAVKADLKGILTEEQLAKLDVAARDLVSGGMDQFMQHLIGLYPELTDEQMKKTNDLIKAVKDETAKLLPGDVTGTGMIRARFQQTFRNDILTEAQRKIERIKE